LSLPLRGTGRSMIIDGNTTVYGLIGNPVGHSLSPAMQNAALRHMGLNGVYVPFNPPPDRLGEAVGGIRALGIAGVNVTVPYKVAVMPLLDRLTGEAVACGAVNTIVNRGGVLLGHNTDGQGFIRALRQEHGFDPARGPAVIYGAGGSARAVAAALVRAGCPGLALVNRRLEKAQRLAEAVSLSTGVKEIHALPWDGGDGRLADFTRRAKLLVNCTPLGMPGSGGGEFPIPPGLPGPGQLAYDLVYSPLHTPFMELASRNGAAAANGLSMLLHQGALSLEKWTGRAAPLDVMRRELYRRAGAGAPPNTAR